MGAISGYQHAARQRLATLQRHFNVALSTGNVSHAIRAMQRYARCFTQQCKQPLPDIVQFDNLPQRRQLVIFCGEGDKSSVTTIADMHGGDGSCAISQRLPDADARQLLTGTRRQRNSSSIKARMRM